jgi:Type II secretion system (T2SS), protein E, N-terminal domain
MASIRLGDLLFRAKVISETQLKAALSEQQKWGGRLGEILVRLNFVTEEMIVKALAKQMNVMAVNLEAVQSIPPQVKAKVPLHVARELSALPLQLRDEGKTLLVAMVEPQNLVHLDTLRAVSRCRIQPQLAGRTAIARAFGRFYEEVGEISDAEDSFKVVDAHGNTIVRARDDIRPKDKPAPSVQFGSSQSFDASLAALEEAQRQEVALLKAMVELLIAKGIFSREEYLARVKQERSVRHGS